MEQVFRGGAWALAVACSMLAGPLAAQTVYRCGNSYSQAPCPDGEAVDVGDMRTPAQRAQAEAAARQTAATAQRMQNERLAQERAHAPARSDHANARASTPPRAAKTATPSQPAHARKRPGAPADELFTAAVPADDDKPKEKSAKGPVRSARTP